MSFSDRLRTFDGHSSVSKEFRVYSVQGAVLSVVTLVAIVYLVFTELGFNFQTTITERVHVNASSPVGLDVEFDISLPQVPCSVLNIDANDPTGQTQSLHLDRKHHIFKHRIRVDEKGKIQFIGRRSKIEQGSTLLQEEQFKEAHAELIESLSSADSNDDECGSCYGAGDEGECCNTCDDVKRAYGRKGWHLSDTDTVQQCKKTSKIQEDDGEGCNVHGIVALDTGGGNFHLAPGRSFEGAPNTDGVSNIFELLMKTYEQWNVSHTVHKLRFGDVYPGRINQLDGQKRSIGDSYGMYQYYFKIVPTRYKFINGTVIDTNQFSVTEHMRHVNPGGGRGLPGVFFFYEVSPLHVEIVEGYRKGYTAFFTSVCAIVGGVVTTMGMIDQFLHQRATTQKDMLLR